MSFHKRYIDNDQIIRLYKDGGVNRIKDWFTKGVDATITETGLSSEVGSVLSDDEWRILGIAKQENQIIKLIQQHLGVSEISK
tara:strand:- start:143 stop:391 length:249 start_codon:yes stop_codon:yes gene_type:complete